MASRKVTVILTHGPQKHSLTVTRFDKVESLLSRLSNLFVSDGLVRAFVDPANDLLRYTTDSFVASILKYIGTGDKCIVVDSTYLDCGMLATVSTGVILDEGGSSSGGRSYSVPQRRT